MPANNDIGDNNTSSVAKGLQATVNNDETTSKAKDVTSQKLDGLSDGISGVNGKQFGQGATNMGLESNQIGGHDPVERQTDTTVVSEKVMDQAEIVLGEQGA
ncbi:hypothetical protein D9613_011104 [Agrocybe pediades]|uniref:Uncharacterized protein n=1 Tax=Agrocybe pediades TaxID=84607 RepID=A0A8H4VKG1_9AGAR|nr:hypothetical protein D9613_011104 [Agrocybe pediades]